MKLGINGFGRIGRAIFKINQNHNFFNVVGVNDTDDVENMAYLLKYDSTYGRFETDIKEIKYTSELNVENIEWVDEVDVLIDATGVSENVKKLKTMLDQKRLTKAVITHCSDDVDKTIIMGANELEYNEKKHDLVSSSICDANAVAQVLKIVNDKWKIKNCFFTTFLSKLG